MTGRELIEKLKELGEENLDREVIMFDGPAYYTPCIIKITGKDWSERLQGKIMID